MTGRRSKGEGGGGGAGRGRGGRRGPRGRTIIAVALLGFVLVATGVIWRRSFGFAQQREIEDLTRRLGQLRAERGRLEGEIREASGRAKLAPLVERRLNMHVPSDSQIILLPRPAAAAASPPKEPRRDP
jgi:hypothetical protein